MTTDMRSWLTQLEAAGELRRITASVDWDLEIGAIARVNQAQEGPGLIFENIKGYEQGRCTKMASCTLGNGRMVRLMLGIPKETSDRQVVATLKNRYANGVPPVLVKNGPVQQNIVKGADINLEDFPAPRWYALDGGRYIDTFSAVVTSDPEIGQLNVGLYRGQIIARDRIGKLIVPTQHWGQHFVRYRNNRQPMPVAIVCGWHDVMPFCAGSPFAKDVCEYDMMGAILGEPVELVKCQTNDLLVPASAEIVIEGTISSNPDDFEMEGPFAEYPSYAGGRPSPKPVVQVSCITHRNQPYFRGALEGARPGFPSEDGPLCAYSWSAIAWSLLERAGFSAVTDVHIPPVSTGTTIIIQIDKRYHGQAQQIAASLWGHSSATFFYKTVIVVEQDIDIRDWNAIEWAIAYRVNAAEGDISFYGPTPGSPLDPSVSPHLQNLAKYGMATWTRVLVDATRSWHHEANPDWSGHRFPPVATMAEELEAQLKERWSELGISDAYLSDEQRDWLTYRKIKKFHPEFSAF